MPLIGTAPIPSEVRAAVEFLRPYAYEKILSICDTRHSRLKDMGMAASSAQEVWNSPHPPRCAHRPALLRRLRWLSGWRHWGSAEVVGFVNLCADLAVQDLFRKQRFPLWESRPPHPIDQEISDCDQAFRFSSRARAAGFPTCSSFLVRSHGPGGPRLVGWPAPFRCV